METVATKVNKLARRSVSGADSVIVVTGNDESKKAYTRSRAVRFHLERIQLLTTEEFLSQAATLHDVRCVLIETQIPAQKRLEILGLAVAIPQISGNNVMGGTSPEIRKWLELHGFILEKPLPREVASVSVSAIDAGAGLFAELAELMAEARILAVRFEDVFKRGTKYLSELAKE